jgi:XTP/dITP diphosphohydrolase
MNVKIILATSNQGKVREIKAMCDKHQVMAYSELIETFEIIEDADTFKDNALLKAHAVHNALKEKNLLENDMVIMSDDSGISVDALDGAPGIYSARYGGEDATDKDNLNKLMNKVKEKKLESSEAHYTAAIALVKGDIEHCVHGWMYGDVITSPRGEGGFGYDPCFIPKGYDKTLGELSEEVKQKLSHRAKALSLAKTVLQTL